MALYIQEFRDSRKLYLSKDAEKVTCEYVGYGEVVEDVVWAGFDAFIPPSVTGMTGILPRIDFDLRTVGGGFWTATATFAPNAAPSFPAVGTGTILPVAAAPGLNDVLGADFSFDFTGVEEHITQSKETMASARAGGGLAPDHKRAIGVTKDGEVLGCDRLRPNLEWTRSVTFDAITFEYILAVKSIVGCTNNADFYNFPPGSLIFVGGTAQTNDVSRAVCTFKFIARDNEASVEISPDITGLPKRGSEFLWVLYKDDKTPDRMIQVPDAVYIERIVDAVDFGILRIGT